MVLELEGNLRDLRLGEEEQESIGVRIAFEGERLQVHQGFNQGNLFHNA